MVRTNENKTSVKNGIKRMLFSVIALLLEALLIVLIVIRLNDYAEWIAIGTRILAFLLVLGIYSMYRTASLKMPWIILIMTAPLMGVTLYLLIGLDRSTWKMRLRYDRIDKVLLPLLKDDTDARKEMRRFDAPLSGISDYLKNNAGYPLYLNTEVTYYDDAEKGLEAQLAALREAKRFIFMEYHAIEDAESFRRIVSVLRERAASGVEVRLFYDDMGSIGFINKDFIKRMEAEKIRCRVFNPFAPGLNIFLNYRDHRKITVVDNEVGFTGGYNLANEYFHITGPFGFWKDTGIRLTGDAVSSLTVTFLEMWNAVREDDMDDKNYRRFLKPAPLPAQAEGFVQPYADSPMDQRQIGEDVYISIAEKAVDYVWFVTPYLVITDEMTHALSLAARRGVDVRIITPGIPDKKVVYAVTRSYYHGLVRNGVRIFEYTPGFCHCKMCVSDDKIATCGTINLDYRSLYHHFENGCLYADCQAVIDTRKDFENMFEASKEVTYYYAEGRGAFLRFSQLLLRFIAPLL